jgi:proteasome accessory factor A
LRPRIYGTETEYALHYRAGGDRGETWDEEELARHFEEGAALIGEAAREAGGPAAGEFLGNGGRFYLDRGGHPEYATPECRSVFDLVAHELAGDRLMLEVAQVAQAKLEGAGRPERLSVFKNNADFYGNSYGSHENYWIAARASKRLQSLIPFLVTRQVFAGAGKVAAPGRGGDPAYQVSQRADFFGCVFNDRATGRRGIIHTRKREVHQPGENRRLHVIVGDSNLAETAMALKLGSTGLVLRLLEEGRIDGLPRLAAPVDALKMVSRDPGQKLELEGKRSPRTALEIQTVYLEQVQRTLGAELEGEEARVLDLWAALLEGVARVRFDPWAGVLEDDPDGVRRQVDWVLKLWVLNRSGAGDCGDEDLARRRRIDLRYHDLDPHKSIFARCRDMGLVDRVVEEEVVSRARVEPPGDTRAWTRGLVIREMARRGVEVRVSGWDKLRVGGSGCTAERTPFFASSVRRAQPVDVKLDDPFLAEDPARQPEVRAFLQAWDGGGTNV